MYFPVSGVEVAPWVPPVVAFAVSFVTSMGGVSGAFLLVPFQLSVLGSTSPSVTPTNHLFNALAIPPGVYRYAREGRVPWSLAWVVIAGTVPGTLVGTIARVTLLPDPRHFKLFVASVLLVIGLQMLRGLLAGDRRRNSKVPVSGRAEAGASPVRKWRIQYEHGGRSYEAPAGLVLAIAFVVGGIGGAYGIGGGSLMAPLLVSCFGLPVHTVAGAALLSTFCASAASLVFYQGLAFASPGLSAGPDWPLGLLFGLGGMAGIYLGARLQKFVPSRLIKALLCVIVGYTAFRYVAGFF